MHVLGRPLCKSGAAPWQIGAAPSVSLGYVKRIL